MERIAGTHAVGEALRSGGAIERVHVLRGGAGRRIQEVVEMCRALGIPVRFETREALDRLAPGVVHQGVVAVRGAQRHHTLEELVERAGGEAMLVLLDGVEDPHNLGAIIRTAHAAGAAGVVIPERRAAGLTPVVAKAAAGALEHLPVARVTNINRAIEFLKESGYWVYGLDQTGESAYDAVEYGARAALVVGGEGHGLHASTRGHCDALVRIPMAGAISSLNVSVAVGVALFEWRRRRCLQATEGSPSG